MGAAVHNVFVYGTLLADEVLSIVLERIPPSSAALLPHFHRFSIKGRVYPAILPAEGDKVHGKVLFGLTDEELKFLDDFEDVEYTREIVEPLLLHDCELGHLIEKNNSSKLQSYAYVWTIKEDDKLFGDWNYEEWRKLHLQDFVSMCSEYATERSASRLDRFFPDS